MSWTFSPYWIPTFLAGAISLVVVALAWSHRSERTGRPLIVLMLGIAWWSVAYGVELGFQQLPAIVLWDKIAFLGSVTVPAAMVWLAIEYAGFDDRLPRWTPLVLLIEPAITIALVWSYPGSRLVWESFGVQRTGDVVLPAIEFGPWYWVNFAYSYVLIAGALGVIAYVFVRGRRIYRRQAALLIAGAIVPLGANVLYNLFPGTLSFPAVDLTTFAMALTGALYGLGLFRFRMLELAPMARTMILDELGDGYLVVDADGALAEGNDIGWNVLADADNQLERRVRSSDGLDTIDGKVLTHSSSDIERSYELRTEAVTDFRDERVGTLVVFRDITELQVLKTQRERLSVVNRILRHNIRNEMNVVRGRAEILAEELDGQLRDHVEAIDDGASRMVSIGEKARHISVDVDTALDREPTDVVPVATTVVTQLCDEHPSATMAVEGADAATALVSDSEDLEVVLRYLVENSVEHNDTETPRVDVEVSDGSTVDIAVKDDGPGIPRSEREVLEAGTESPLQHGSGLGLWIVNWLVEKSDGELTFSENQPRGSVVTVSFPSTA